jgi:hypothetical protein
VALRLGRGARQEVEVAADARPVIVLVLPDAGPLAEIAIEVAAPEDADTAAVGIGVIAVMACAPGDLAARLGFLEHLRFVWPEPAS